MARYKFYLQDKNVLEAARERVAHVFELFDSVAVMFSGGKDSLVTLHLTWQEAQRRGHKFLNVIFRDEELIPDSVVNFVDSYRQKEWVKMRWLCLPMQSEKFILGKHFDYVQWDQSGARPHIRPMPEWAERWQGTGVFNEHTMDEYCAAGLPGKVGFMLGIRAAESLTRYRSVVNKLNENYICATKSSNRVMLCKPVYDWEENDVLKFFHDEQIPYCPLYDQEHLHDDILRVATPLHAEASKVFGRWRRIDPDFYARLIAVFPEMTVQERYWVDYDRYKLIGPYVAEGWSGVDRYISEHIVEPHNQAMALKRLDECKLLAERQPDIYTPEFLMKAIASGAIKRTLIAFRKTKTNGNLETKAVIA